VNNNGAQHIHKRKQRAPRFFKPEVVQYNELSYNAGPTKNQNVLLPTHYPTNKPLPA